MTNTIIEPILDHCIKIWASDIHMTEWETIGFRIHGELGKVNGTTLDAIKINKITEELFKHDEKNIEDFHQKKMQILHIFIKMERHLEWMHFTN